MLRLPGVAYLVALHDLDQLNYGTMPTILVILGFIFMLLNPIEVPLLGYAVAPERTVAEVQRFRAWLASNGLRMAIAEQRGSAPSWSLAARANSPPSRFVPRGRRGSDFTRIARCGPTPGWS